MMKFAGDNLIMVILSKNAAGRSRKAAQELALRGFARKKGKKLMIRVRCNLIMLNLNYYGYGNGCTGIKSRLAIKHLGVILTIISCCPISNEHLTTCDSMAGVMKLLTGTVSPDFVLVCIHQY
jgi:hypothetical protein